MIYLDYASSTPISRSVVKAMYPFFNSEKHSYANSNSSHKAGELLNKNIEIARYNVSKIINSFSHSEIIFTSGATESNNMAILGSTIFSDKTEKNHIITTKIEHASVLNCFKFLEKKGYIVDYLSVDENGIISISELKKLVTEKTFFVSIMHVNNETGATQNIEKIAEYLKKMDIIFHVDAAQSLGKIKIDVQKISVDLLSISGHKIYGPKGIGALYARLFPKKTNISPIMFGSDNERGLRPGSPSITQIVGFGKACFNADRNYEKNFIYLDNLKKFFLKKIKNVNNVTLNGCENNIVPGIINIRINNIKNSDLKLLQERFLFSFGSSCSNSNISYVLKSMNFTDQQIKSSIRVSFGLSTKKKDLLLLINNIKYKSSSRS